MALSVDFSVSQTPGAPGNLLFTDESTGSDGTITQRRIYIQKTNGDFIVLEGTSTEYEPWTGFPGTTTIELEDILDKDYGVKVVVQWLTSGGTVVYDKTKYYGFPCYNEDFDYELTQNFAANQLLMNNNNWWFYKSLLQTLISSGNRAIERASDINACQQCYDEATELREFQDEFFNQTASS